MTVSGGVYHRILPRHGCRILWYTPIFMLFFTLF